MKRNFTLLLCLLLMTSLLAGCTTGTDNKNAKSDSITISMSDEAKKFEEENITQDGVKTILKEDNFEIVIAALSARGEQTLPECKVENKLELTEYQGSKVYSLTKEGYDKVILFTHGGGWVFGISEEHVSFCDKLASRLNAKVYMPLYPLAPEANSEETYQMIEGLYKKILKENKDVYIMGDSAGGNITLGLMYTIKEEDLTKPKKMVLIAPCADMTFSNPEMVEINKTDHELDLYGCSKGAELWAGKDNLKKPKYSALYADVSGYPDTMIFQGTNDILYPDNVTLCQNLKDAGVNVTFVKGEGFWHVFPIYPIPERAQALDLIEEFCGK